jgi:hypothetical protein
VLALGVMSHHWLKNRPRGFEGDPLPPGRGGPGGPGAAADRPRE